MLIAYQVPAQAFRWVNDIPVSRDGNALINSFAGGLLAPQFSEIDADLDGDMDLAVFDRYGDRLTIFTWENGSYNYRPDLAAAFPEGLDNWVLFRDFNNDGRNDLFVSTSLGMEVYVNISADGELRWRKYHDRSPGPSPLLTQGFNSFINLQLNATDIPAIDDVDSDGDLDILVFRFAGGSTVEWHRNFAIERTGRADSMQLERVTSAWGAFRECICGTFAFDNEDCPPIFGRPMHEGGKTLTTLDLDGDGDRDAMVSEETCDDIFSIRNDGDPDNAFFTAVIDDEFRDAPRPFFPAAFQVDVDHDEITDLVISTNWPSARQPGPDPILYYRNAGSNEAADFVFSSDDFLAGSMIDVGSLSHPAFYDINDDGLVDMFIGRYSNRGQEPDFATIQLYLNEGSADAPQFRLEDEDFMSLSSGQYYQVRPVFTDLTGDGIPDFCFTAIREGLGHRMYVYPGNANGEFLSGPLVGFTELGEQDVISIFDADQDGINDLLVGRVTGNVDLYSGSVSGQQIIFTFEQSSAYGLGNDNFRGATFLLVEDIDFDGTRDILRADSRGGLAWLPDGNTENEWLALELFADDDGTDFGNPGRDLAPVMTNILGLDRNQLVLGSGAGGIQVFSPDGATGPIPGERSLTVYPNPVASPGQLRVRASQSVRLSISDMAGRILGRYGQQNPVSNYFIETNAFPSGIYIVTAQFQNGARISRKFIVIR